MGRASAAERWTMWQGTLVFLHTEITVSMAASSMPGGRDSRKVEYRPGSPLGSQLWPGSSASAWNRRTAPVPFIASRASSICNRTEFNSSSIRMTIIYTFIHFMLLKFLFSLLTWSLLTAGNSSTPEWMRKHLKPGTPRLTISFKWGALPGITPPQNLTLTRHWPSAASTLILGDTSYLVIVLHTTQFLTWGFPETWWEEEHSGACPLLWSLLQKLQL